MEKRRIIFGAYDTAANGWTLTGWVLTPPEQKTNYLDKPSGDGSWDLSTALSDGIPRYKDRQLTVTLECSDGTRADRELVIRNMVNTLDGHQWEITLPDDSTHYLVGRVHVNREYNDPAHAAVTVTATCEPWKYAKTPVLWGRAVTTVKQTAVLTNKGRRAVVPTVEVSNLLGSSVFLEYGTSSISLGNGIYRWPELLLTPGSHQVVYSSTGSANLVITYREAVLE